MQEPNILDNTRNPQQALQEVPQQEAPEVIGNHLLSLAPNPEQTPPQPPHEILIEVTAEVLALRAEHDSGLRPAA